MGVITSFHSTVQDVAGVSIQRTRRWGYNSDISEVIWFKRYLIMPRLCKICEKVEVRDEYVVICKDCSRICFNMEAWLTAPTS
jgi:hypothetical protein